MADHNQVWPKTANESNKQLLWTIGSSADKADGRLLNVRKIVSNSHQGLDIL
jgi:hypothetical protein